MEDLQATNAEALFVSFLVENNLNNQMETMLVICFDNNPDLKITWLIDIRFNNLYPFSLIANLEGRQLC